MTSESHDSCLVVVTTSPEETRLVGEALGRALQGGSVVCLCGDLGTGKTCLTQGIGRGMDVAGTIHSPTFVFINEHPPRSSGPCLYHVDLYRIQDVADAFALGLEDYMCGDGVTVIEWADRARELLPGDCLWVTLVYLDERRRRLRFEWHSDAYAEALAELQGELAARDLAAATPCDAEP